MERILFFSAVLVLVSGYAVVKGGAPERVVGLSLLIAYTLSILFQESMGTRFLGVEWGILAVDAGLLAVLLAVAMYADRFWPLWIAAFQALGTGGHLVRGVDYGIEPVAYAILLASWSYPMVLLLLVGTWRHAQRHRRGMRDLDWSHISAPARV